MSDTVCMGKHLFFIIFEICKNRFSTTAKASALGDSSCFGSALANEIPSKIHKIITISVSVHIHNILKPEQATLTFMFWCLFFVIRRCLCRVMENPMFLLNKILFEHLATVRAGALSCLYDRIWAISVSSHLSLKALR